MHRFDYSFLDNGLLPAQLLNLTADIYSMRAMAWDRRDRFSEVYTELEQIAKVQSVKSSNEMEQLVLTYRDARDNPNVNQLLLIPCVILDFLCIHPFRDGNGRLSRLLSLLLLYKNGFDAGKYISFEEQINLRKGNYYEALKQSSSGWHESRNDYSAFIMEFLTTLYMCYKELDKRFAVVGSKKVTKQARVEATVLNSLTPISKADIMKILPDVSGTTVEAVLGQMVKSGQIQRIGSGRATRYIRA